MFGIIVAVVVLAVMLALAIILLQGKGSFLIAGFNMLPRDQKEKVDWPHLCKFMGKILLGVFVAAVLILARTITGIELLGTIGLSLLAVLTVGSVIWTTIRYMP